MNYTVFTKTELIKAIEACDFNSRYYVDRYLLDIRDEKAKDLLSEIGKNNNEMISALECGNLKLYKKLNDKSKKLDKKWKELYKALD